MAAGTTLFQNMEDVYLRKYASPKRKSVTIGFSDRYDIWGRIDSFDELGRAEFLLNGEISIQLNIPGRHNFMNALIAAAVGLHYGVSETAIREVLESFQPASQRMEVFDKNGILLINDAYNANPNSMAAAVDYLAGLQRNGGKRILVLGDMLELGEFAEAEHRQLGRYITEKAIDVVFLYGPESRYVQKAIKEDGSDRVDVFWYKSHEKIAAHLGKILAETDVVLFKGSRGMRMEKVLDLLF